MLQSYFGEHFHLKGRIQYYIFDLHFKFSIITMAAWFEQFSFGIKKHKFIQISHSQNSFQFSQHMNFRILTTLAKINKHQLPNVFAWVPL